MSVKLAPVVVIGTGALFVYSGIRGFSVLKAAQNVIRGSGPNVGQNVNLLSVPGNEGDFGGGNLGGPGSGTPSIAANAQKYIGKLRYVFGGPNPANPGTVDCSSFASKVLAESGVANPGGARYDPRTHGPTTLSYLGWNGAKTIGHNASDAQPGDLCCWQTHMGIAIGNGSMVSARDPAEGVGIDQIQGDMPGEFLFVRRVLFGTGGFS